MNVRRREFIAGSLGAAAALALPRPSAAQGALTDVTVLFPRLAPGSDYSFLWAADALGYFRDEGLKVSVQPTGGSPDVARLIAAGQGDIGISGAEAIIVAASKGLPIRDVFCIQQQMIYSVGVPAGGSLHTAADLKGKRIGVQSLSASPVFVAKALLREAGLNPERDATFIPIGVGGQAVAAVKSGQVDAVAFHDTQFVVFRDSGLPYKLLEMPKFRRFFTAGLVVKTDSTGPRAAMIAGFSRAIAKGLAYSTAGPEASIKAMTQVVPDTNKDPAQALSVLNERLTFEKLPPEARGVWGWNTRERYAQFADFLYSAGVMDTKTDGGVLFDGQFLKRANAFDGSAIARAAKSA
jgi:NitT/TauT family transport system substrate-binding protein